jgi:hypothetical protein
MEASTKVPMGRPRECHCHSRSWISLVVCLGIWTTVARAQPSFTPKQAAETIAPWFDVDCAAAKPQANDVLLAINCGPHAAPVAKTPKRSTATAAAEENLSFGYITVTTLSVEDYNDLKTLQQRLATANAQTANPLERIVRTQERSPRGRIGLYTALPGQDGGFALGFLLVEPSTRRAIILNLFGDSDSKHPTEVEAAQIAAYGRLRQAAYALEQRFW